MNGLEWTDKETGVKLVSAAGSLPTCKGCFYDNVWSNCNDIPCTPHGCVEARPIGSYVIWVRAA